MEQPDVLESYANDSRMVPLLSHDTFLVLYLYILKTSSPKLKPPKFSVLYGFAIRSPKSTNDRKCYARDFKKVTAESGVKYEVGKVTVYESSQKIVEFLNAFAGGLPLKACLDKVELDSSVLSFDVDFSRPIKPSSVVVRPITYNETIAYKYKYWKPLISPFRGIPSYSIMVCNLNRQAIFRYSNDTLLPNWEIGLIKLLQYLEDETRIPFSTSSSSRYGNIELINNQCSDIYDNCYVNFYVIKDEEIATEVSKPNISKRLRLSIEPNDLTNNKNLTINCRLVNGKQVVLDEIKEFVGNSEGLSLITFESTEPFFDVTISIWIKTDSGSSVLWYKHSVTLIRSIVTNMGMVGLHGTFKSDWLNQIGMSSKVDIKEYEKISRASYQQTTTGNHFGDPWVDNNRSVQGLVERLNPAKSDSEFFPKGWDSDSHEHGAISFLAWFQKNMGSAGTVIIQDPFFDTVGLEFLARTTNSQTKFFVVTSTQIHSLDDENTANAKSESSPKTEPNRARRLKAILNKYPTLFGSINLRIHDIRGLKSQSKQDVIHDRYILVYENQELKKGFHLSNSLQGATRKHPLLITVIPLDVLKKVETHLQGNMGINQSKNSTEPLIIYDSSATKQKQKKIIKDVADSELLSEMLIRVNGTSNTSFVEFIEERTKTPRKRNAFWSTFGYLLATNNEANSLRDQISVSDNHSVVNGLFEYLKDTIKSDYPIGFRDESTYLRQSWVFLYEVEYGESLKECLRLEQFLFEGERFGNWGAHFGSRILLHLSISKYLELVDFIHTEYLQTRSTVDVMSSSVSKLNTVAISKLSRTLFWDRRLSTIALIVKSDYNYLKPLATAALFSWIHEFNTSTRFKGTRKLLKSNMSANDYLLTISLFLLNSEFRKKSNVDLENFVFDEIVVTLKENRNDGLLEVTCSSLADSSYPLIEKKITEGILIPMHTKLDKVMADPIFEFWYARFINSIKKAERSNFEAGELDLTAWSYCIASDIKRNRCFEYMTSILKEAKSEIWKPFNKGTVKWESAFDRVHLVNTTLKIILMYDASNTSKIYEREDIVNLVSEMDTLSDNYRPLINSSQLRAFSKRIRDQYMLSINAIL